MPPRCSYWHHTIGVTKALKTMNRRMNLPNLQKIMMEFERESEIMDLKEETISDTIDDVIGNADDEEVSFRIYSGVHIFYFIFNHVTISCHLYMPSLLNTGERCDCFPGIG